MPLSPQAELLDVRSSSSSYLFYFTLPFIDVTLISPFTVLNKHSRARSLPPSFLVVCMY
jgi:hypothetical protein